MMTQAKPLCRCGHPVTTHDETGCRRLCGCTRDQAEAAASRKD